jgi:hypothetical protein
MKTPLFFLSALAAFFALPLDFMTMVALLFTAGLAAIMVADYRRTYRSANSTFAPVAAAHRHNLRLAA